MAPKLKPTSIPEFAAAQLSLLATELAAEEASTTAALAQFSHAPARLQRSGLALTNLIPGSRRTGLGGRTVVEFVADPATSSGESEPVLPEHGIRVGDIVRVTPLGAGGAKKKAGKKDGGDEQGEEVGVRGVVTRVRRGDVAVALDGEDAEEAIGSGRVWLVKLADEVTFKR